jgi:hypothetical protein
MFVNFIMSIINVIYNVFFKTKFCKRKKKKHNITLKKKYQFNSVVRIKKKRIAVELLILEKINLSIP